MRRRKLATAVLALFTVVTIGTTMILPTQASAASRPAKVKSLKVSSTGYNSLKVSWKRVKNAKGYQVYRATKKNGKYKRVKTIKKGKTVSWTNKKLTTGKRYYYKVRAYKGKQKGSFSAKKSGVPKLTKTSGVKASTTSSSAIKISWKKTSGATGYQVYRATSKSGSYSKVKTTSSASFTNTGLAASKTYYYKVRAYKKIYKGKILGIPCYQEVYSSYSNIVSAKTKAKVTTKPTTPTQPTNPTTPVEPSKPEETNTLNVVDRETGKDVTELQAGRTYDVESSSTVYIGTDKNTVGTAASSNKAAQICHYARRELHPISKGVFWLKNDDGVKKQYQVVKGTSIQTGDLNVELGGSVPSGYTESYDTIYGYRQYVYNKDKANLVLVGAENGAVKTVFTMAGTYNMNTDEEYLSVKTAEFGGTTIQPIRYYSNKIIEGSLAPSAMELKNEGILANYVANAVRLKHDSGILDINAKLTQGAEEQSVRVSEWTGDSGYWHYIGGNPGERYGALGVEDVNENITSGGMGSQHCIAVQAVENFYTSAGHVQNLLDESHQFIGTGIVYNGADDFTVTQAYAGPQS